VWTFAPIFSKQAREDLNEALKTRITELKSDFGTYLKNKKKSGVAAEAGGVQNKQKSSNQLQEDANKASKI